MSKKLTIEFVRKEFEKEGYVLLSNAYINNKQKLNYICPEGHTHYVTFDKFKNRGDRCPYCSNVIKLDINFIEKEFKKEGYKLLSDKYIGAHSKLDYICPNGHKHTISWTSWQKGRRCYYCFGIVPLNIDFIRKEFEKENYKLLTKVYKNARQKLDYICSAGHKHSIRWYSWKTGQRCFKCKYVNSSGELHPNWKGGISCEPYCQDWTKDLKEYIKERDGYKCLNPDCWGNIQKLSIHHIDYNKKNCELYNLITLCPSCNSRANKDRKWHRTWYTSILLKRYDYQELINAQ